MSKMSKEMLLLKFSDGPIFTKEVYLNPEQQEVRMYLKGPLGTAQFCFWLREDSSIFNDRWNKITGFDLGYHSPKPMYDGQTPMGNECSHVPGGGACYYDGTSLGAKELSERTMEWGDFSWTWRRMEEFYYNQFGGDPNE